MNYSEILHALQGASLFDLYRLRVGIDGMLDQPERLLPVRRQLHPGMEISYFSGKDNKQVDAVVEGVHRVSVHVRDKADGKKWSVPLYAVNLSGANTDIHPRQGQTRLDKNLLKVGESVGFHDRHNRERYGKILQLNQKTASLLTNDGMRWRVAYGLLFKVMEAEGYQEPEIGLIEGEIIKE
ncbi:MAG: hypothetical protein HQL84_14680 [Magnetococcales bacterium]|nr:hypothetical protein [Magnetococcales bacterium]MBF0151264.1 hypothetical protein [Magnetococcales bacterium]